MPGGLAEAVRRANKTPTPEDSIPFRLTVLAAVLTSAAALAAEGAIGLPTLVLVVVLIPIAYWVSWIRRGKDNWHIKIALAIAAILALIRFMGQARGVAAIGEIRFPLADLFLMIQIVHSFDLPARKDLLFSLGSSLTLMAVAGSLSQTMVFALFLLVYFGFATAALALGHRSEVLERLHAAPVHLHQRTERRAPPIRELARAIA